MLPQVRLKKEYNDAGSGPGSGRAPPHRLLSGGAWYSQQAFRALNQVSVCGMGAPRMAQSHTGVHAKERDVVPVAGVQAETLNQMSYTVKYSCAGQSKEAVELQGDTGGRKDDRCMDGTDSRRSGRAAR